MTSAPHLRPLGEALGTEVVGVDLARLDDATFAWIATAFAEHPVLVFRGQSLGASDIAGFGRRFGTPRPHSLLDYRHVDYPEVSWLRNVDAEGRIDWFGVKRATDWHTDSTFEDEPPILAMLHAIEVPGDKGGTVFADMRAAYDALPAAMKTRLAGLTGLHGHADGPAGQRLYNGDSGRRSRGAVEQHVPAVINHRTTGRPILFVNPVHTHGFVGMERDESWALVDELANHAVQPQFVYYHQWRVGDLVIWDEQATMHRGAGDARPEERRIMLRTIVYRH